MDWTNRQPDPPALARDGIRAVLLCSLVLFTATVFAEEPRRIHVDIDSVERRDDLQPVDGIRSAGQPDEEAFRLAAEAGYVAVIDLRGPDENRGLDEAALLEELGLDYESLPVTGRDAINTANAATLDDLLAGYDGPVLIHCGSGNRVGALLALRESLHGAEDEEALEYGKSAGLTSLEPVVRSRLAEDESGGERKKYD